MLLQPLRLLSLPLFLLSWRGAAAAIENANHPAAAAPAGEDLQTRGIVTACTTIASQLSSGSQVYYVGSLNYLNDNQHYMISSSQAPACVVEVGSADDTSKVIKIIAAQKASFAIIAGGHASNQGFSSTKGVLVSLVRLKNVDVAADKTTVTLGTGNRWATDVYPKLDGTGYNVVGGRVTGPAVGGLTLGGGFSWLTNQHGLTVDTVLSFTLVQPNGAITTVDSSQPDLFFALKGGLNRFGIVTAIKYKLFPAPTQVYGGYQVFPLTSIPRLISAVATFAQTNTDPKAQVILNLSYLAGTPQPVLLTFYDGPTPGPSLAPFSSIPALFTDVKPRSFSSLAQSAPSQASANARGAFHTLSTAKLTRTFIEAVNNQSKVYGALAVLKSGVFISYDIEPFADDYGSLPNTGESAYPHSKSPKPLFLYFTWLNPAEDGFWRGKMQESVDFLTGVARSEGIYDDDNPAYPNYALDTYTGPQLYGSANAARLKAIKAQVDPNGVMDLTTGFKF